MHSENSIAGARTGTSQGAAVRHYFRSRWSGEVSLGALMVRDMLILGTLLNVITTLLSLAVLSAGYPAWLSIAVFVMPVPYNLFLMLSVWRAGERRGGLIGTLACIAAALWMLTASLI